MHVPFIPVKLEIILNVVFRTDLFSRWRKLLILRDNQHGVSILVW
jgi:hypothetical protein